LSPSSWVKAKGEPQLLNPYKSVSNWYADLPLRRPRYRQKISAKATYDKGGGHHFANNI
jgi:hypothetical protein